MATFLINKVKYSGDDYIYESPDLGAGLNIIEGDNGKGKSTFFNLIYFCLSGTVDEFKPNSRERHNEITNDKENYVELKVLINDENFSFRRYFNSNEIWIIDSNDVTNILPIYRNSDAYIFSDWILDKLGITVVDIIQGTQSHKVNIKDLLRLIYHDQQPNPKKIYKPAENDGNFISDSLLVRKIIFQLLLGETFSTYYEKLAELKIAENEKNKAKVSLDEYLSISSRLRANDDDLNADHIKLEILSQQDKLDRLLITRNNIQVTRPVSAERNLDEIERIKLSLLDIEDSLSEINLTEGQLLNEIIKFQKLIDTQVLEVTQLKKIMHSHEKLNLFTPDTCPYCLKRVQREEGFCVCGSEVDESQYERFFYNSSEYGKILKSKQKSVQTIQNAIDTYDDELTKARDKKSKLNAKSAMLKSEISELVKGIETTYQNNQLDKVDDEILFTKERIENLHHRHEIELKLQEMQKSYDDSLETYKQKLNEVKRLELEAESDINSKILDFNSNYEFLMTRTLQNCRSARIDSDNYMPVINNGEYREVSSSVSIRLNYFLTFLKLSLEGSGIAFPKFLLIDTPRTAGIDEENFNKILLNINEILTEHVDEEFQIILSTGIKQYPQELKDYVFDTLTDTNRLLKINPDSHAH